MATRLDRLARSTRDLLDLAESLNRAGTGLRSLAEPWADTTSPAGKRVLTVFAGIVEFERAMLREHTRNGLAVARKEGRVGGWRPKLTQQQQKEIVSLVTSGQKTDADAARLFRVHPATVARLLAGHRQTAEVLR